ncbi:MAG: AAA family ATPase [Bacteroidia bacterium]
MITKIEINGFKSFHEFTMEFTPFTVIAGANASGKSNLFDALKLIQRLAETDNLKKAFKEQRGEFMELFTQYENNHYATEMTFAVEMLVNKKVKDAWGNEAPLKYTRLRYEITIERFKNTSDLEDLRLKNESLIKLNHSDDEWVKNILPKETLNDWRPQVTVGKRGLPYIEMEENPPAIVVRQDGTQGKMRKFPLNNASRTILSSFDTVDFPHVLAAKEEMKSWKFLQLNPEDLRSPTKKIEEDEVSESGKYLAAALYRIKKEDDYTLKEISRKLQTFLPNFTAVDVIDDTENQQYVIKLTDVHKKEYTSRVLSEGTLRILALCILEHDSKHSGLLCFEEPENGVHPVRIKMMADLLKDLSVDFKDPEMPLRQVIVNTHSPVLVGNMHQWETDNQVSIGLSRMTTKITTIADKRIALAVTTLSILPTTKKFKAVQGKLVFDGDKENLSPSEKLTIKSIKEYLETASNFS